jgi:hypothetical protein
MSEEAFYDQVAVEIQQGHLKPGLWTKAFADANGEQTKARVIYIRERVSQLQQEAAEAARDRQESDRQSEQQRQAREQIAERKRIEDEFNQRFASSAFLRSVWLIPIIAIILAFLIAWLIQLQ